MSPNKVRLEKALENFVKHYCATAPDHGDAWRSKQLQLADKLTVAWLHTKGTLQ